jgi:hypothetical protein
MPSGASKVDYRQFLVHGANADYRFSDCQSVET